MKKYHIIGAVILILLIIIVIAYWYNKKKVSIASGTVKPETKSDLMTQYGLTSDEADAFIAFYKCTQTSNIVVAGAINDVVNSVTRGITNIAAFGPVCGLTANQIVLIQNGYQRIK